MKSLGEQTRSLMEWYPRIYMACHSRHVRDRVSGVLVSQRQIQLLDHLDSTEPAGVSDLARHLGVTASTISLGIDRLERKGYVRRQVDADDGRRIGVLLTDAGVRIREAHSVLDPERVRALLSTLTESERTRALEGLALLGRATKSVAFSGS